MKKPLRCGSGMLDAAWTILRMAGGMLRSAREHVSWLLPICPLPAPVRRNFIILGRSKNTCLRDILEALFYHNEGQHLCETYMSLFSAEMSFFLQISRVKKFCGERRRVFICLSNQMHLGILSVLCCCIFSNGQPWNKPVGILRSVFLYVCSYGVCCFSILWIYQPVNIIQPQGVSNQQARLINVNILDIHI